MIRRAGQGRVMLGVAVAIGSMISVAAVARTEESSFNCPTDRWIKLGDPLFEAKGICGEPTHVVQRNEKEKVGLKARRISGGRDFIEERVIDLEVEEWYYDLGSKRRARILRFENGRLATISIGKYGGGSAPAAASNSAPAPDAAPDASPK